MAFPCGTENLAAERRIKQTHRTAVLLFGGERLFIAYGNFFLAEDLRKFNTGICRILLKNVEKYSIFKVQYIIQMGKKILFTFQLKIT